MKLVAANRTLYMYDIRFLNSEVCIHVYQNKISGGDQMTAA